MLRVANAMRPCYFIRIVTVIRSASLICLWVLRRVGVTGYGRKMGVFVGQEEAFNCSSKREPVSFQTQYERKEISEGAPGN